LLYVASTRAQKHLVLPWFAEKGERIELLLRGFEPKKSELVEVVETRSGGGDERESQKEAPVQRDPEELMTERRAWLAEREALLARASKPLVRLSPSKLAGEVERDEEPVVEVVREQAMEFGVVVHEALERLTADGIGCSTLGDPEKRRATQMVERALDSDLLKRAKRAEQVYRELPFTLAMDGGLMEGKIDLLFCEKGKWVLVDYKTDARVEVERYSQQIRAYESALKQVAGIALAEKLLFFLATGTVEQVDE
jgi:ATP-dependent exoDNAse (exonuclease V) beta subunit